MKYYPNFEEKVRIVRQALGHPLTLSEKILYSHLFDWDAGERWNGATGDWQGCGSVVRPLHRLADYGDFRPDRVALQDATGQMALLQFMNAGKEKVCTPASVHCDHLICASDGADNDLFAAREANMEVYDFLSSASSRYGIDFWQPGAGIIHQIVLENYAFPGGMMVGTDSHTPNAGGLSMLAIGGWRRRCRRRADRHAVGTPDAKNHRGRAYRLSEWLGQSKGRDIEARRDAYRQRRHELDS